MKRMLSRVEILSQEEVQLIHKAALGILEKTGIQMPDDECLRRCEKVGAKVDYVSGVVCIPREVMEDIIELARAKQSGLPQEVQRLSGGISTQIFVTDYLSKTRRPGNTDDVLRGIAMVQHLSNIPHCNAAAVPSDVDSRISDLHACHLIYKYSKKPGGTYIINPGAANAIMDMAECLGRRQGYLFESVSPLRFRKETLQMGLMFADRGHGLGIGPMIMGGSTGPVTMAGIITLAVAEVLASLFGVYALTNKVPLFFGHGSHSTDPRTMLCSFGSPNQAMIGIGTAQMARFYGVPSGSNTALSDALMPDFQCGFEKTFSALFSLLAGSVGIGCQGIAGADQGFSFEQLVIDNEWIDAYNYVISGYEATEETIAEELINEVGIGGNFISEEHTVKHLRESWWPSKLFTRESFDQWTVSGKTDILDRAHALVETYTKDYKNIDLAIDGTMAEELDRIAEKAKSGIMA
ncbi:MAG: trimethylamine methyltransferase family protein [Eubacteriales bacterium]